MKYITAFDAADYLDNDIVIAEYLNAALEEENPNVFLQAIADVAKARGMTKLAQDTGLGRESLYKALAPGAKPRYDTVIKLVRALSCIRAQPRKPDLTNRSRRCRIAASLISSVRCHTRASHAFSPGCHPVCRMAWVATFD